MSVESVNNSGSNAGLYATGAAVVGAGAGAAAGYLTKPFLKDGAPTDSFIKKMGENVKAAMSPEEKELAEVFDNELKKAQNAMMKASSVEELKSIYLENIMKNPENFDIETAKSLQSAVLENFIDSGIVDGKDSQEYLDKLNKVTNFDELKTVVSENFDKEYAGKNIDQIKEAMKKEIDEMNRKSAKAMFEPFWDSSKKEFVNCEEGVGAAIKKAAKSIQGKYAMIYGAIGAAVLGLGTLLCCGGKKSPQHVQKELNTQA